MMAKHPIEIYELEMALRKPVRPTSETASHATLRDFCLAYELQALASAADSLRSKATRLRAEADEIDAEAEATEARRSELMRTGLDASIALATPAAREGGERDG